MHNTTRFKCNFATPRYKRGNRESEVWWMAHFFAIIHNWSLQCSEFSLALDCAAFKPCEKLLLYFTMSGNTNCHIFDEYVLVRMLQA